MKVLVLLLAVLVSSALTSPSTMSAPSPPTAMPTPLRTNRPPSPPPILAATEPACPQPFERIGGQCLLLENSSIGTYHGMIEFCEMMAGRIVKIPDADSLYYIADHLFNKQLTTVSFWIGATDEAAEGDWKWEDGSRVLMRTPFWANQGCSNVQAPDGGEVQNCAILDKDVHFYFNDVPCNSHYGVICEAEW